MARSFAIPIANFQFSLRWLFVMVSAAAVVALVARLSGGIEAVGTALSLGLLAACLRCPQFRHIRLARGILVTLSLGALWFAAVDYSVFRERCDQCGLHWWEGRYRIFGQSIWHRKSHDHQVLISQITEDLGTPCLHDLKEWDTRRTWGLIVTQPIFCGTCCLSGSDNWYDESMRQRVRRLAAENPHLGREFHENVLVNHDHLYLRKFISDLKAMEDP